ncbi:MAG: 2-hydroxyacyl-CoA dehydratase [candidate division WOR-3 bacterium]
MKATFPCLGYDTCAIRAFFDNVGIEVVEPPPISKKTIELGVRHSPELICMPFKITLGSFIEAMEAGADTFFMAAGARRCRFGYYHYLQGQILRQLCPDCRLVPVGQYSPYEFFFRQMPRVLDVRTVDVIRALRMMLVKSVLTREFRQRLNRLRAVDFDRAEELKRPVYDMVSRAGTTAEVNAVRRELRQRLSANGCRPEVTVGLVGEIYYTVEQAANQSLELELGRLGADVLFERSLYHHLRYLLRVDVSSYRSRRLARRYLRECPGGEALRTVGEAMYYHRQGVDGIIHVFPFTCMPENIALEALQKLSEETGMPVLSLSFDEHTSPTGLVTRLEAFVDLIRRRKRGRRLHRS